MATSFERRHLPDKAAFHKRPSGGGIGIEDALLLEDDTGTLTSFLLLEDDTGTGTSVLLLEEAA